MAIELNTVEETLFIPLWCRAQASIKYQSLFYDSKAVELVQAVDYDFSVIDARLSPVVRLASVARARQCDDVLKTYIADHPRASVVDLGAGLDTMFYRIDNGLIEWYDLDLPNVIAMRKQLLPETDRVYSIAKSLLDMSWCDDLTNIDDGVFAVAGAVLGYFSEGQMKTFFSTLADRLPGVEMVFTAYSSRELSLINRSLQRSGMTDAAMKWALEDANDLTRWDDRISVVDEFSFFRDIPYNAAWGEETLRKIRVIDEHERMRIVHVRFNTRKEIRETST
jgi:O-methyltransferase involved in polyketide biosynthesis